MIKAHKIRLHPTPEQAVYFAKAAGTHRFVWNWALAEWNRQYEAGEKPTAFKLKKQFNEIRREQFPWTWEVTKNASDQPFLDLGKAFTAFFEGKARRPRFKSKKRSKPSFYLANDQLELGDHRVWIPKLGWVNMAENLRFKGTQPTGNLEYWRGIRKPSLPQNGTLEAASGQQTAASSHQRLEESGESAPPGGPAALPHHLHAR